MHDFRNSFVYYCIIKDYWIEVGLSMKVLKNGGFHESCSSETESINSGNLRQSHHIQGVPAPKFLRNVSAFLLDAFIGNRHHFFLFALGELRPVLLHLILPRECKSEGVHMRFAGDVDGRVLGQVELQGASLVSDENHLGSVVESTIMRQAQATVFVIVVDGNHLNGSASKD